MPKYRSGTNFAKEIGQLSNLLRRLEKDDDLPSIWRDAVTGKVNDVIRDLTAVVHDPSHYVAEKT